MSTLLVVAVSVTLILYALAVALGALRLVRGPHAHDRVLALDFLFVVVMLTMLVLAIRDESSVYFEAALLMALADPLTRDVELLPDFFQRMHAPSLANTLAAWCMALASIVHFSFLEGRLSLHVLVINVLLAISAPVTTMLLARAALFRRRQAGDPLPPPLGGGDAAPTDGAPS